MYVDLTVLENQFVRAEFVPYLKFLKAGNRSVVVFGAADTWYVEIRALGHSRTAYLWNVETADLASKFASLLAAWMEVDALAPLGRLLPDELQACAAFGVTVSAEWIQTTFQSLPSDWR